MTDPVWVLQIEHEHGVDTVVCKTQEIARNHLVQYVEYWWEQEFENEPDSPLPEVIYDQDIERYFEKAMEVYTINLAQVIEE